MIETAWKTIWLTFAATSLVLLTAGSSLAVEAGAMPCSAFSRTAHGGWRVLSPVMLDLNGRLYSPTVGTTFAAGSATNGIEMSDILDEQCGNQ